MVKPGKGIRYRRFQDTGSKSEAEGWTDAQVSRAFNSLSVCPCDVDSERAFANSQQAEALFHTNIFLMHGCLPPRQVCKTDQEDTLQSDYVRRHSSLFPICGSGGLSRFFFLSPVSISLRTYMLRRASDVVLCCAYCFKRYAFFLFVAGGLLMLLAGLMHSGHVETRQGVEKSYPLFTIGSLMFIPGAYVVAAISTHTHMPSSIASWLHCAETAVFTDV